MGSTSLWIVTSTFRICKRKSTKPRPLRRKTYGPSSVFLRPKNYPGRRHLAVISPRQPIVRLSATIRYPQPQSNCDYRFLSNYILMLHYQLAFFTVSERQACLCLYIASIRVLVMDYLISPLIIIVDVLLRAFRRVLRNLPCTFF